MRLLIVFLAMMMIFAGCTAVDLTGSDDPIVGGVKPDLPIGSEDLCDPDLGYRPGCGICHYIY